MIKRISILLPALLTLMTVPAIADNIPAQFQAIQQQLTAIQNALGTQGTGLNSLSQQLQTLQNTLNSQGLELQAIESSLASVGKPRKFYLTKANTFDGVSAPNACAGGFHMASLFEIFDPSSLQYDTTNGHSGEGSGPPSFFIGWIRSASVGSDNIPGERSCGNFTLNDSGTTGTVVSLQFDWTGGASAITPWMGDIKSCDTKVFVWCMQN